MENQTNYRLLLEQLKRTLRLKGWNYSRLAGTLGVSEPTIKRIFTGANCSIQRLMKICDAVGVSFFDQVLAAAKKRTKSR